MCPSGKKYLSFTGKKYFIQLERLTKLNKNAYEKIKLILIDLYIKLNIGLLYACV